MGGRRYAAGAFLLDLDGKVCGGLHSVEGGAVSADVVREAAGPGFFVRKHIGHPRYEDVIVQFDLSLDRKLYEWIADAWAGGVRRYDGSILALDGAGKTVSERRFFDALLTEVTLPALDAASQEPAYLTVKLSPEIIRSKPGSGATVKQPPARRQKAWLALNFRLEIDGLDCSKVGRIDALTVRQEVVQEAVGEVREVGRETARLDFPNLRVTLAESSAATWTAWFDSFVVKGVNSDADEKSGRLTFLAPDLKSVLGRVTFDNLGIFRLEREPRVAASDTVARVRADLYCERMELKVP